MKTNLFSIRNLLYSVAREKGNTQNKLLMEICANVGNIGEVNLNKVLEKIRIQNQKMAKIQEHWAKLTDDEWLHLAEQYLLEIRLNEGKNYAEGNHKWDQIVVSLDFWSPPHLLWKFILLIVSLAETDEQLGLIAAGEIEHLLGRAGDEFIDLVEQEAKTNPKFARTLTGCYQFQMSDEIWSRVKKLQAQVGDKLL